MGKKKFIDKKNSTTYSLVFRPTLDDDEPGPVPKPVPFPDGPDGEWFDGDEDDFFDFGFGSWVTGIFRVK